MCVVCVFCTDAASLLVIIIIITINQQCKNIYLIAFAKVRKRRATLNFVSLTGISFHFCYNGVMSLVSSIAIVKNECDDSLYTALQQHLRTAKIHIADDSV